MRTSRSRDEPLPSFGAARLEYEIVTGPTFQFKFVAAEPAAGAISPVSISGSL